MKKLILLLLITAISPHIFPQPAAAMYKWLDRNKFYVGCETCSEEVIDRAYHRFRNELQQVEQRLGAPLPVGYPLYIYLTFDGLCSRRQPRFVQRNVRGFADMSSKNKGIVCLNTNMNTQRIITGKSSFMHEIVHFYLRIRLAKNDANLEEGLTVAITDWLKNSPAERTICENKRLDSRVNPFCNETDMEYAKIPLFVSRILEIKRTDFPLTNDKVRRVLAQLQSS